MKTRTMETRTRKTRRKRNELYLSAAKGALA